jgi:hypothetical protein
MSLSILQLGKKFAPAPVKSLYRRLRAAAREWKRMPRRYRDTVRCTRSSIADLPNERPLHSYLANLGTDRLLPQAEPLAAVAGMYLEHRFDLLGSGWTRVEHGVECAGLLGRRFQAVKPRFGDRHPLEDEVTSGQLAASQEIESMLDADYRPIDWHIDFKSGHRWSPTAWYLDAFPPPPLGADVKVPWELGRLQHLPQLAAAARLSDHGAVGFAPAERYRAEFRNQTLDFLARNPPRFGVNWACTMDVGIRVANLLLAHDLFVSGGESFDEQFEREFIRGVWDHARHIAENLEWSPTVRSNHYLANVVGLLFAAAYLPSNPQVEAWLAFSVQELIRAVGEQFRPDGANFEASTCYHRLSGEMIAYGTAIVLGLPTEKRRSLQSYDKRLAPRRPHLNAAPLPVYSSPFDDNSTTPFPPAYWDRLKKIFDFTTAVTKPSGELVQVGDNDAGRFCKPVPRCELSSAADVYRRFQNLDGYRRLPTALPEAALYPYENPLRPDGLLASLAGVLNADSQEGSAAADWEADIVASFAGRTRSGVARARPMLRLDRRHASAAQTERDSLRYQLRCEAFPDFGVYVYRSPRLFLAVRCGGTEWIEGCGHAHEDQLSLELTIDGIDLIRDPGTLLYTSAPDVRNCYRSRDVHFVPKSAQPAATSRFASLFALPTLTAAECRSFEPYRFVGFSAASQAERCIEICDDSVCVVDRFASDTEARRVLFFAGAAVPPAVTELSVPFSPGYGWQERAAAPSADEALNDAEIPHPVHPAVMRPSVTG